MDAIFDLIDGLQVTFERVIKWLANDRFQIIDITTSPIDGGAASTHARMIAQLALLQIWMSERLLARDALVLRVANCHEMS